jgi:hypothetical protein
LATPTREELIGLLDATLGVSPATAVTTVPGGLPLGVAESLLEREVNAQLDEALAVPDDELAARARATLRQLQTIASNPLFSEVDRALLTNIEDEARSAELTLNRLLSPRIRFRRSQMAVGGVAASPAAPLIALLALAGVVTAVSSANRFGGPDPDVNMDEVRERLRSIPNELRNLVRRQQIEEAARRQPAPTTARTSDVIPDAQPQRRRRDPCRRLWVARPTGSLQMRYHNDYAAYLVAKLIPGASPDLDFRVTKGGLRRTDYDSYDAEKEVYYEFKTRHDYLRNEGLVPGEPRGWIRWMRISEIIAQAWDQRETLIRCGFDGDLVWIFEDESAATAVRAVLGGWPIDRVIAMRWDRKDRARGRPPNAP